MSMAVFAVLEWESHRDLISGLEPLERAFRTVDAVNLHDL